MMEHQRRKVRKMKRMERARESWLKNPKRTVK